MVETAFPKKNESKNLAYVTDDRDVTVGNTLKCEKKKMKVRMIRMLPLI